MFTKDDINVTSQAMGIKTNVPWLFPDDFPRELYRRLRTKHGSSTFSAPAFPPTNTPFFIFADNKGQRNLVIEASSAVYRETNRDKFPKISGITRTVYDFLLEKTGGTTGDLKLIGKIFYMDIHLPEKYQKDGAALFVAKKIGIPSGSDIAESGFRFMLKDGDFGIRCMFDSSDKDRKTISVVLDINNHEQESGLDKDFFDRVAEFADTYYEKRFVDLLNELFF